LDSLIEDLLDASKAKKANSNDSNNSKPVGRVLAVYNKGGNKGKKSKGSKCNNCGDPNAYYKPDECFATNVEKRQAWEQKTGKTYIPYRDYKNNKDKDKDVGSAYSSKLALAALVNLESNQ
jgi:hypothetical protein